MGQRIVGIATLIIFGTIVADLVANPKGTAAIANGVQKVWQGSLNAILGSTSAVPS
ncbi:MAG: hypothetical protein ACYDAY_12010 [Candidatus Dormibacteria bacterium]